MRWIAVGVVVVLAAALGLESSGAGTQAVTLSVSQYRNLNGVTVTVFSGTVSSDAAGETVDVLGQDCGTSGFRLISGTHTRGGGGWQVEHPLSEPPWRYTPVSSSVTYRARWNDQLSDPHVLRPPAPLNFQESRTTRLEDLHVSAAPRHDQHEGQAVELQRNAGGSWRTDSAQEARLQAALPVRGCLQPRSRCSRSRSGDGG